MIGHALAAALTAVVVLVLAFAVADVLRVAELAGR